MGAINNNKKKIEAILKRVRPYIQMHGGNVELIELKTDTVILKIRGACASCPMAGLTYNEMIGTLIKEKVPEIKKVILI